jgi:hypothetical protein
MVPSLLVYRRDDIGDGGNLQDTTSPGDVTLFLT